MKNSQSSSTSNIETLSEKLSVPEQRELLLTLNPDLLYGVYQQSENTDETIDIQLSCPQNILTAYTNQLPNIQGLDKAPDISLIDLGGLRK